jgi:hypothetical protein
LVRSAHPLPFPLPNIPRIYTHSTRWSLQNLLVITIQLFCGGFITFFLIISHSLRPFYQRSG